MVDEFGCALYAGARAITRFHRRELDRLGLSYLRYLVMVALWEHETPTVGELSQRLKLTTSALSPLLKGLETANFLARCPRSGDERVVRVHATEAGLNLLTQTAETREKLRTALGIPGEQITDLIDRINTLTSRLPPGHQITDPAPPPPEAPVVEYSVVRHSEPTAVVITIAGEIDGTNAAQLTSELTEAMTTAAGRHILVDVQELSYFDSAGIAGLLRAHLKAVENGHSLRLITGSNKRVIRPLTMMGLDHVLRLCPDKATALE